MHVLNHNLNTLSKIRTSKQQSIRNQVHIQAQNIIDTFITFISMKNQRKESQTASKEEQERNKNDHKLLALKPKN